ncbi:uncharacterized protein LOC135109820 [Scylla paramamosain]|uniref:uncharacterized protein LOC135109820 n=1 Tax=Scylla paramamosain TaxID=85552 RepID=UPI0030833EFD
MAVHVKRKKKSIMIKSSSLNQHLQSNDGASWVTAEADATPDSTAVPCSKEQRANVEDSVKVNNQWSYSRKPPEAELRSMKCYFGHKCSSVHSATCMSNLAGRCGRSTGASYTRVKWMNWPRSGVGRGAQGWGVVLVVPWLVGTAEVGVASPVLLLRDGGAEGAC